MIETRTRRLTSGDRELARTMFALMAAVFEEESAYLSDDYLDRLLRRDDFWAIAAFMGDEIVGGVTAHTLSMTRTESAELFIYDIAVRGDHQRRGIGRRLIATLREAAAAAGIQVVFVPTDEEDIHALDFYHALGGEPSPVIVFTFSGEQEDTGRSREQAKGSGLGTQRVQRSRPDK